jgi:hypothetical protein
MKTAPPLNKKTSRNESENDNPAVDVSFTPAACWCNACLSRNRFSVTAFLLYIVMTAPDGSLSQVVDRYPTRAACVAEMNRSIDALRTKSNGYILKRIECLPVDK